MLCREYADAAVPPGHEGERVRERRLFVTGGGSASALESLPQLRAALATYGPLPQRCQSAAAGGDPGEVVQRCNPHPIPSQSFQFFCSSPHHHAIDVHFLDTGPTCANSRPDCVLP